MRLRGGHLTVLFALLLVSQIPNIHFVFIGHSWSRGAITSNLVDNKAQFQSARKESIQNHETCTKLFNQDGRNFTTLPLTPNEDARLRQCDSSGISAAICHPTLFGTDIQLARLFAFCSYYRLLGFDHIFFWHTPEIRTLEHFHELQSLPYVTLTEYTPKEGEKYYGQRQVMEMCLNDAQFAASYDWALSIDADEYLWFRDKISVKDFIVMQHPQYNYFSFSKWSYTQMHAVVIEKDSGFDLDHWAFTGGSFCNREYGNTLCPTYKGRCKILAKPSVYPYPSFQLHGLVENLKAKDAIQLDTSEAHLKEWRAVLVWNHTPTTREATDFSVSSNDQVGIHKNLMIAHKVVNGKVIFRYDHDLQEWFRFVASGAAAAK